jgi:acetylornithine deacetylase/succinyl-diaminopimelate desuccinylase family protein
VEDVLQLLADLVKTPSVCGQENRIAHYIADWLGKSKLEVEMVDVKPNRPNVVVRLKGKEPGPHVLLNGHMDTVEPGNGWTRDPFGAEVEDGKMYGRGAFDMKAGLACILWVAAALREEGLPRRGELMVTAVVDEEAIARGTYALVQRNLTKDVEFAMIPEPTNLKVITAHRGRAVFEIEVRGKAAHSGWPEHGVNAIEKAAVLVNALPRIRGPHHPTIGDATINTLRIEGGQEEVMLVPDHCRLLIDRCLVPGYTTDAALQDMRRLISEIGIEAEAKLPVRETPFCESFEILDDEPHVQLVMEAATKVLRKRPEMAFHAGPCDSCILVNPGRVPTIEFGPSGSGLHQPDEYVELDSVKKTAAVYHSIMTSMLA